MIVDVWFLYTASNTAPFGDLLSCCDWLAPDVVASSRDAIVVFNRAFQDEALLYFRMLVKRHVSPRFQLEKAGHLALLSIFIKYLD